MIQSLKNKRALLLGNGVNLLDTEQSLSWGDLLNELKTSLSINVDLDNIFKPFPLAFDEMLHRHTEPNNFKQNLKDLKIEISNRIISQLENKKGFNSYHEKLMSLKYDDILTTNYDYAMQNSVIGDFISTKKNRARNRQERKLSLKRSYYIQEYNVVIWHIHGELLDSRNISGTSDYYHQESIMISYEHYASYLEKIQSNIKGKSGQQKTEDQGVITRIRNDVKSPFWTDIFFTHNIDIVGQTIDFSENHLWWIINYRANYIRENDRKNDVNVNNEI